DVGHANFQFQRGGDAIECFYAFTYDVLAVLVKVDESGGNDKSLRTDHLLAVKRVGGNTCDPAAIDSDIAHSIESCFRVEYATSLDNQIILLREERGGNEQDYCEQA